VAPLKADPRIDTPSAVEHRTPVAVRQQGQGWSRSVNITRGQLEAARNGHPEIPEWLKSKRIDVH